MLIDQFEAFLGSVDLNAYREKYRPIKLVEMDMPKDIQALDALYDVYWDQKRFISFDDFYDHYLTRYRSNIEFFRNKITMCEDCFYRGLPARIYRTWASLVTQIHAGYVAESVFGPGSVTMSSALDHKGADFQVQYNGTVINYQVKKKSMSREVRKAKVSSQPIDGEFIDINYDVPSNEYFENPYKKDGSFRLPYKRFTENPELKRLPNGFVLFTPYLFTKKKALLDSR